MQLDRNAGDDGIYSSVTKRDNSDYHQIGSAVANEYDSARVHQGDYAPL